MTAICPSPFWATVCQVHSAIERELFKTCSCKQTELCLIGEGSYGTVVAMEGLGCDLAVKVMPHDLCTTLREAYIHFNLPRHANIHQGMFAAFIPGSRSCGIVSSLETCDLWTFMAHMNKAASGSVARDAWLTDATFRSIMHDIAQGLKAAHAGGFYHRDLSALNVFLSKDGRARISDWGMARRTLDAGLSSVPMTGLVVSTYFAAPEILLGKPYDERADVWALGMIGFYLLSGIFPAVSDTADPDVVRATFLQSFVTHHLGVPTKEDAEFTGLPVRSMRMPAAATMHRRQGAWTAISGWLALVPKNRCSLDVGLSREFWSHGPLEPPQMHTLFPLPPRTMLAKSPDIQCLLHKHNGKGKGKDKDKGKDKEEFPAIIFSLRQDLRPDVDLIKTLECPGMTVDTFVQIVAKIVKKSMEPFRNWAPSVVLAAFWYSRFPPPFPTEKHQFFEAMLVMAYICTGPIKKPCLGPRIVNGIHQCLTFMQGLPALPREFANVLAACEDLPAAKRAVMGLVAGGRCPRADSTWIGTIAVPEQWADLL